ncbi:MAG: hypothetical protein ACJ0J6_04580 [Dehalococcoidia bacterium]|tara:strand:+ start:4796 stop:5245 length:450 start_codon:yes stop_codon:yes gene_type:complete
MKFTKNDYIGILLAALAGPGIFLIILSAYDLWEHRHTPLLGFLAVNVAIGGGIIGAFSRFIKNKTRFLALIVFLILCILAIKILQWTDNSESGFKLLFIWLGIIDFMLINAIIGWEFLANGLVPRLDRMKANNPTEEQNDDNELASNQV